ncbi:hypothetical protein HMPREF3120_05920 [Corynebacterium sp. HMSC11D10]|nr:hypothetical protein HMPREF3120_05920 [Corynebacterium sp. HMSC11D10]
MGGIAAAALATALVTSAPAVAHDVVIGSNPENKSVVQDFPERIELEFSGEPKEGFNTVAISRTENGSTDVLFTGEPVIEGRNVTLDLPPDLQPEAGDYKVGFQIVSSDGHATKGMTSFSYQPDDAGSQSQQDSTATNAAETNENSSFSALWLLALGTIVLAVIAVLAVTNRSKKSKTITDDVRKGAQ